MPRPLSTRLKGMLPPPVGHFARPQHHQRPTTSVIPIRWIGSLTSGRACACLARNAARVVCSASRHRHLREPPCPLPGALRGASAKPLDQIPSKHFADLIIRRPGGPPAEPAAVPVMDHPTVTPDQNRLRAARLSQRRVRSSNSFDAN